MKLLYVANARMPTEKAHGLQITKMCQAYAALGHEVSLVIPNRPNHISETVFSYYQVKDTFSITYLPHCNPFPAVSVLGVWFTEFWFLLMAFVKLLFTSRRTIVTRDIFLPILLGWKHTIFYEMHDFPTSRFLLWRLGLGQCTGVLVTNTWKAEKVSRQFAIERRRIGVFPNGYDPEFFSATGPTIQKSAIDLPEESFVIMYVGMLKTKGMDKGLATVIAAAKELPEDVFLVFVGGTTEDIAEYTELSARAGVEAKLRFIAKQPYPIVPEYLRLADVLMAPFPDNDHYRYFMSPIKLFEYLAIGKPILTTKLDSIEEILGDTAEYISPDSAESFISGVTTLYNDESKRIKLSQESLEKAKRFTWQHRAKQITDFIATKI